MTYSPTFTMADNIKAAKDRENNVKLQVASVLVIIFCALTILASVL